MFSKIIVGVLTFAMLLAFAWFAVPRVVVPAWTHVMDGEAALRAQPGLLATIAADRTDASKSSATCEARVQSAYKSAAMIGRLSRPQPRVNGVQPTLDADQIRSIVQ